MIDADHRQVLCFVDGVKLGAEFHDSATKEFIRIVRIRWAVKIIDAVATHMATVTVDALREDPEYGAHRMEHEIPAHHTAAVPQPLGMSMGVRKQTQTGAFNGVAAENESPTRLAYRLPPFPYVLHTRDACSGG